MPASLWGKYEIDLVKNFLGPALVLNKYVERWLAWHGYMGTPNAMSQVHEAVATKNTLWTEGRPTIGPEYQTILTRFKLHRRGRGTLDGFNTNLRARSDLI